MKPFSKIEIRALVIIFLVLIAISIPNFMISLRRARDQVRKDDMGSLLNALIKYKENFGFFPQATSDGRIIACKRPGDKVEVDKFGHLKVNFIPCDWGKDGIFDYTPGSSRVFMSLLPREPYFQKGGLYKYISDGRMMQILVTLESKDDPEYDQKIIKRGIMCGNVACNAGRPSGCSTDKSLEQCEQEAASNKQISK